MGRPRRAADGGMVYHVLNRANARMAIFEKPEDFAAFEGVLEEAAARTQTRWLAYCVMPNHGHLVERAEAWRWGSLYRWRQGSAREKTFLTPWPLPRCADWSERLNQENPCRPRGRPRKQETGS